MYEWKNIIDKELKSEDNIQKQNQKEQLKNTTRLTLNKDGTFELHDWRDFSFFGKYEGNIVTTNTFTGTFTNDGNSYTFSAKNFHQRRNAQ